MSTQHSYFYIHFIRQPRRVVCLFSARLYRLRFVIPSGERLSVIYFFSNPLCGGHMRRLSFVYYSIVSCIIRTPCVGTNNINVRICFMCVSVPMSNNQNQQDYTSIVENQKLSTQVTQYTC